MSKHAVPVYHPLQCSGCLACQISCAQLHGGTSRPSDARVKVLQPMAIANPTVLVSSRCDCPDGAELCQQVCGPEALRFLPREETLAAVREGWQPSPIVD